MTRILDVDRFVFKEFLFVFKIFSAIAWRIEGLTPDTERLWLLHILVGLEYLLCIGDFCVEARLPSSFFKYLNGGRPVFDLLLVFAPDSCFALALDAEGGLFVFFASRPPKLMLKDIPFCLVAII